MNTTSRQKLRLLQTLDPNPTLPSSHLHQLSHNLQSDSTLPWLPKTLSTHSSKPNNFATLKILSKNRRKDVGSHLASNDPSSSTSLEENIYGKVENLLHRPQGIEENFLQKLQTTPPSTVSNTKDQYLIDKTLKNTRKEIQQEPNKQAKRVIQAVSPIWELVLSKSATLSTMERESQDILKAITSWKVISQEDKGVHTDKTNASMQESVVVPLSDSTLGGRSYSEYWSSSICASQSRYMNIVMEENSHLKTQVEVLMREKRELTLALSSEVGIIKDNILEEANNNINMAKCLRAAEDHIAQLRRATDVEIETFQSILRKEREVSSNYIQVLDYELLESRRLDTLTVDKNKELEALLVIKQNEIKQYKSQVDSLNQSLKNYSSATLLNSVLSTEEKSTQPQLQPLKENKKRFFERVQLSRDATNNHLVASAKPRQRLIRNRVEIEYSKDEKSQMDKSSLERSVSEMERESETKTELSFMWNNSDSLLDLAANINTQDHLTQEIEQIFERSSLSGETFAVVKTFLQKLYLYPDHTRLVTMLESFLSDLKNTLTFSSASPDLSLKQYLRSMGAIFSEAKKEGWYGESQEASSQGDSDSQESIQVYSQNQ